MQTIKAIYDGKVFTPTEPVPVNEEYEVLISFVNPVKKAENQVSNFTKADKEQIAKALYGILPSDIDLDKARVERLQ